MPRWREVLLNVHRAATTCMRLFGSAGRPRTGRRRLSYTIEHVPELVAIVPGLAATALAAVSETPAS